MILVLNYSNEGLFNALFMSFTNNHQKEVIIINKSAFLCYYDAKSIYIVNEISIRTF